MGVGKFFGIGTGPGDSDLLTIKGQKVLQEIDCLYTPEPKKGTKSLALSIVSPYVREDLVVKQRHFPMVKDWSVKEQAWDAIANEILEEVKAGKKVGFITLGDPMVYSTYSYLLNRLKDQIETETIPGISSFCQMSNSLQIPLVMDDESYAVVPSTASDELISQALTDFSTIVIMKAAPHLEKIMALLTKENLLDQAVLISNASMENEVVTKGLSELDPSQKISYYSTIIVYKTQESFKERV
ncbi:cobalt-factor II C(20)-methyltransferase [Vagococcus humatus]|uniref:Precorrin-2 C(20)-methyltransferase n=1 Tax=Vagococcus humatus TaxID=1889241 RepID=A0A3S0AFE1_9ENTE|nr:cobalt-factor II C(20)-methyltransferase [Vagococcus humatus]RST90314.1 precorrin-2 C(20)-methyltransferase [Vagococcus humatus]